MKIFFTITFSLLLQIQIIKAQDTFSIVALDSTTRQVGSAGASCLDLYFAGYSDPSFLADLLPDTGAINTQSYYIQANQDNARNQMRSGATPAQIITWLVANDAINNPEFKQYGIVGFNGKQGSAAAHTGNSCIDYKNHITGNIDGMHYAIQGNILKGQMVLDSMESKFRNTKGTLACRLMAAMQGANIIGADTRCNNQNTSSLFAFLQVALPQDKYKQPSLNISLRTKNGDGIEPIDSLQILFNKANACMPLSNYQPLLKQAHILFPNPANDYICIDYGSGTFTNTTIKIYNSFGQVINVIASSESKHTIQLTDWIDGVYFYQVIAEGQILAKGNFQIRK
jgi:uncharacterized Ntn-hydrolase superfamily protein